jgi:hypothetical protein
MKKLPGSVRTDESVRLRGDLTVIITHALTGRQTRHHIRNTITYSGLNSALYAWSQDTGTANDYRIVSLVPGSNSTPPSRGDTAVISPAPITIPLTIANRTVSSATGELVLTGTLGTGDNNGIILNEVGLVMGNGALFARQVHPDFTKTNAFTLTYTWRIAVTA